MNPGNLQFLSEHEFSPVIVWDALTDPTLLSGWFAPAVFEPRAGGPIELDESHLPEPRRRRGTITIFDAPVELAFEVDDGAHWRFHLEELPYGFRGTSTRLTVSGWPGAHGDESVARADWLTALDQLDDLLRGHPVDWSLWQTARLPIWNRYRWQAGDTSA